MLGGVHNKNKGHGRPTYRRNPLDRGLENGLPNHPKFLIRMLGCATAAASTQPHECDVLGDDGGKVKKTKPKQKPKPKSKPKAESTHRADLFAAIARRRAVISPGSAISSEWD